MTPDTDQPEDKRFPDFFVIGAMKSGSTTLHQYLTMHPRTCMSEPKEPGFFSRDERYKKGSDWYFEHFRHFEKGQIRGDSSTCYSRSPTYPHSAQRIYDSNPDAKFIYVVRDPVSRAYSHYKHRMEEAMIQGGKVISYKQSIVQDEEMLLSGKYHFQIKKYTDLFGPINIYICNFDNLITNPLEEMNSVYQFLGIDSVASLKQPDLNENISGTAIKSHLVNAKLNKIKSNIIVRVIRYLTPVIFKKNISIFLKKVITKSTKDKAIDGTFNSIITSPSKDDIAFLERYYEKDTLLLQQEFKLNLTSWQSSRR